MYSNILNQIELLKNQSQECILEISNVIYYYFDILNRIKSVWKSNYHFSPNKHLHFKKLF